MDKAIIQQTLKQAISEAGDNVEIIREINELLKEYAWFTSELITRKLIAQSTPKDAKPF